MQRLIDADKLKQAIADNVYLVQDAFNSRDYGMFWTGGIEKAIDDAPTVAAEPVVRCKDCKECEERHTANYLPFLYCKLHEHSVLYNAFCSWAAKMNEVEDDTK